MILPVRTFVDLHGWGTIFLPMASVYYIYQWFLLIDKLSGLMHNDVTRQQKAMWIV
jgi:hypothetical protein